jgi:hypothetical protein
MQSREMPADMVHDRLRNDPCELFSVEIFDAAKTPLVELRLVFEEVEK